VKEISLNVLDILENSINAQAKNIKLTVIDDEDKDYLFLEIKDDGKGMSPELKEKVFDPFFTSSSNKKVGLGLPLLKYEAESCGGFVVIESQEGKGTVVKIKFKKSHVDRPPLGDLVSTILFIFTTHPEINFSYIHQYNDKVFEIKTQELREACGEDLCSPFIIKGIEELIRNNLNLLYGGDTWTR